MAATSQHTPDSDYFPFSAPKLTPIYPPQNNPVRGSEVTPVSISQGSRLRPRAEQGPGLSLPPLTPAAPPPPPGLQRGHDSPQSQGASPAPEP